MNLRAFTGYVAHAALLTYWVWVVAATAPELRKGHRDRQLRLRLLVIKTAALALTALVVGVVHYWATEWWQVLVTVPVAAALGVLLRRSYRRTVAAPRHRLTLGRRARTLDLRRRTRHGGPALHRRPTVTEVPPPPLIGPGLAPPEIPAPRTPAPVASSRR